MRPYSGLAEREMDESQFTYEQIREFVLPIAQRMGIHSFSDEESLIHSGIIGSLAVFRLVSFLEETFSVTIADEEIVAENFDSIDKINCFVMSKLRRGREPQL
jgi:acyl carrier protein